MNIKFFFSIAHILLLATAVVMCTLYVMALIELFFAVKVIPIL